MMENGQTINQRKYALIIEAEIVNVVGITVGTLVTTGSLSFNVGKYAVQHSAYFHAPC
jgi:hypothetical protein